MGRFAQTQQEPFVNCEYHTGKGHIPSIINLFERY